MKFVTSVCITALGSRMSSSEAVAAELVLLR